jgi:short subunit dehydrogenase-like uncharacterized protein
MAPRRVILIGATGYTGGLVARQLVAEGLPFVLTGRDPERLARVARLVGDPPTHRIDLSEDPRLGSILRSGDVVINCAGPFSEIGESVVRACVVARAHYLDTTGEQRFMKRIGDAWHRAALEAEVAIVNAMGFDYAIGDALAGVLGTRHRGRLRSVDVFYGRTGGGSGTSQGTKRSILGVLQEGGFNFERGRLRERQVGSERCEVRLADGQLRTAIWFPAGESVTVPRHVIVERVSGWIVVRRSLALVIPAVSRALPPFTRLASPLTDWLIRRSPDPPEPDGRDRSRFRIEVRARSFHGEPSLACAEGRDPYGVTAAIIAHGAHRLLASPTAVGVLAPAQLVEPERMLDMLAEHSLRWDVPCTGRNAEP